MNARTTYTLCENTSYTNFINIIYLARSLFPKAYYTVTYRRYHSFYVYTMTMDLYFDQWCILSEEYADRKNGRTLHFDN